MELWERKGGSQSWGHVAIHPSVLFGNQACYQGDSSTATGVKVRLWTGTGRGQSFEDICFLHEEWEVREVRAIGVGREEKKEGEMEGWREGLCASEQGISFMQIFATQNEKLHL